MHSITIFMEGIPNPDPLDLIICWILIFYSLKKYLNRVHVKPCSSYLGYIDKQVEKNPYLKRSLFSNNFRITGKLES